VDNSLIGGRKWQVEQFFKQFIQYLKIERLGQLKKHLGVWWEWKEDPQTGEIYLKVTMSKMVQEIKEAYGSYGQASQAGKDSGISRQVFTKSNGNQRGGENHWLIVGKLMYYMTKVGLELANPIRELAGQMMKPNKEHWKAVK